MATANIDLWNASRRGPVLVAPPQPDVVRLASTYLAERIPDLREWPAGRLERWVGWHWHCGESIICLRDERPCCVLLARLTDAEHASDPYHHAPGAPYVYIAAAATETTELLYACWRALRPRLGPTLAAVAMHRRRGLRTYPLDRIETLFRVRATTRQMNGEKRHG
ncbi:MAG: hypothetical protein D6781_02270 [Verrucomicrobia bacterium]|nr:MAG: hypothetical protein D6781_02270 [Verrucomicrobiota bacterium]